MDSGGWSDFDILMQNIKNRNDSRDYCEELEQRFAAFKALVREYRKTQKELYEHETFPLHANLTELGKLIDKELEP